jgi:hypothetical protein
MMGFSKEVEGQKAPRRKARSTRARRGSARLMLYDNDSNESFLHEQARGVPLDELLARP